MTTPDPAKAELLEAVLMRAAETLGDLTGPTMGLFYERYPDALAAFEHHGFGKRERLEADMVDTALYCVMTWLERPAEVAIMLYGSVPHHRNTLKVHTEWYRGLLSSLIDLVAGTVPAGAATDAALVEDIRAGLFGAIDEALADQPAISG
ncbi:MAG: hypothetical protein M0R03_14675 [Novosphingobium sp.]|nr:hypothetical protein [Novosphingobium sp.]